MLKHAREAAAVLAVFLLTGCTAAPPVRSARTLPPNNFKMHIQGSGRIAKLERLTPKGVSTYQEPYMLSLGAAGGWGFHNGIEFGMGLLGSPVGVQLHLKKSLLSPEGYHDHFAALLLEGAATLAGSGLTLGLAYTYSFNAFDVTLMGRSGYATETFFSSSDEVHQEQIVTGAPLDVGVRLGRLTDHRSGLEGGLYVLYRHMNSPDFELSKGVDRSYGFRALGPSIVIGIEVAFNSRDFLLTR
jgi:hypothetical protein